jgi:hypothetical protein
VLAGCSSSGGSGGATTISLLAGGNDPVNTKFANDLATAFHTANPTINDASPVLIDAGTMALPATGTTNGIGNLVFDWSRDIENLVQVPTLRGTNQQICLNFNGTSPGTALLNGSITWTEE